MKNQIQISGQKEEQKDLWFTTHRDIDRLNRGEFGERVSHSGHVGVDGCDVVIGTIPLRILQSNIL